MRDPCIREFARPGTVGHGGQFAELAAGLAGGESQARTAVAAETCSGRDALLLQSLIG